MTDTYTQLKDELSILYPDVTDTELNEMTDNLINFYKTAVKAVLNSENNQIEKLDADDNNFNT
ncbi:MAG: hypothetical protein IJ660_02030 [Alphaproteobacteria bacterium]|nr:hypothetical protein [Alphaproteobacteria bacterium]